MKTLFQTHTNAVLCRSSILATLSLLCFYSAGTNPLQAGPQNASSVTSVLPVAQVPYRDNLPDYDAEYLAIRREYLNRLLGSFPPGVSPAAYASSVAAVRALPPSPLMRGQWEPAMPQGSEAITTVWPPWFFPVGPPPIDTAPDYGGDASAMIHDIGAHPTNSAIVYAGNFGGLVKSINGGVDWQYISDSWLSQEVSSIAIDPAVPNYLYVGTGRNYAPTGVGLYRSFDAGVSWALIGATVFQGKIIRRIAIDPNTAGTKKSTVVYVANPVGLWRSTDSGVSWLLLRAPTPHGTIDVAVDSSTNPSTLYTSEVSGVYRGVFSPPTQSWTWTQIFVGNFPGYGGTLSVVNSVPYVLALHGTPLVSRLYKYSLATQQWTEIPTLYQGGQINPWGIFAVDPNNPAIVLVGREPMFRTTDATAAQPTWIHMNLSDLHVDQRAIAFSPATPGLVYSGNDGGIKKSASSGANGSWTNLNANLPGVLLQSGAISRDDTMISGTQDNGAVFTYQGTPWDMIIGGDGARAMIHPTDSTIAYVSAAGGQRQFYKYIHPGTLFSIRPPELNFGADQFCHPLPSFSLNPNNPQDIIASCMRVMRSKNGGTSWTQIGPALGQGGSDAGTVVATCEAPSDPDTIYAIANEWGQHIYVTTDAQNGINATWDEITSDLPDLTEIWAVAVHPTNPLIAYLATNTGVHRTTNMGGSWTPLTPLGSPLYGLYISVAIDPNYPNRIFAASRLAGVLGSTDSGATWSGVHNGMPAGLSITQLSFNGTSRQLAAATYGRGAYRLDLDDVFPEVSITAPGDGDAVSGTVVVSATASDNHRVDGVLFKVDGNPIGNEDTSAPYSVNWDTNPLSPGNHTLTAVARDPANNLTTSVPVIVKVLDNDGPAGRSR